MASIPPVSPLPLSLATLRVIMPKLPATFVAPLNFAMGKFAIDTPERIAAFLAQIAHESSQLSKTHELWSDKKDFQLPGVSRKPFTAATKDEYFNYWYDGRAGNTQKGDGMKFRGRGAIQLTGRANYTDAGKAIGQPLDSTPDLVETDPLVNVLAAAWFFAELKRLNPTADLVKPDRAVSVRHINAVITKQVNGGHTGERDRLRYYQLALHVLIPPATTATPGAPVEHHLP